MEPSEYLAVTDVHAGYGVKRILRGVSLVAQRGQIVLILGPNGAGKSTLLKCLSGAHPVGAGDIRFEGASIRGRSSYRRARMGIAWAPEGRPVIPQLTVTENLNLATFATKARSSREATFRRYPQLRALAGRRAGTLSGGERQMVALARALEANAKLLLLDEPSLGLSPKVFQDTVRELAALREDGMTCVIVEQRTAFVVGLADRIYLLLDGQLHLSSAESIDTHEFFEGYTSVPELQEGQ